MVFKLVRTDAEDPNKMQLPLGTHLIGRGKLLECDDKRISRNHGHLIVTENSLAIEALHQNPCFFTKKGSEGTQVLKKSSKETLENGDRFGLLPGLYWYEVLQCTTDTDSQATDVSNSEYLDASEARTTDDRSLSGVTVNSTSDARPEDEMLNFDLNETVDNAARSESPSLLDQQNEPLEPQHDSANESLGPANTSPDLATSPAPTIDNTDPPEEPSIAPTQPESSNSTQPEQNLSKSPKRSHSPEEDESAKRIKTEPDEVKQELLVKQDPDAAQAGPSGDGPDRVGGANADGSKAAPAPAPPRERCFYGASCYRRNIVHKAQFAHPGDADWGAGDRTPCPYGAACRKREPRHWQVHDHPHPQPPGAQVVERRGRVFYINAHAVNFYDDHFQVEDSEGDSVDFDYEF